MDDIRHNLARATADLDRMREWFARRPRSGLQALLRDMENLKEQVATVGSRLVGAGLGDTEDDVGSGVDSPPEEHEKAE